jgi:hypothetical protein
MGDKMKHMKLAGLAAAALAAASYFLEFGEAKAETGLSEHDGIYVIHIVTLRGSCDRTYTANIAVSGNQVRATGDALIRGSGRIDAEHRVLVTLWFLHYSVHVTGKMRGESGVGIWSLQALSCGGSWAATRA